MTMKKILIPLGLTLNDRKSINFIINRFALDRTVDLTLFYIFTPVPEIDVRNNPIMEKMNQNLSYQRSLLNTREMALHQVKQRLLNRGFRDEQVHCVFAPVKIDVPRDIIKFARSEAFEMVIFSRTPDRVIRFFTRSVSKKVAAGIGKGIEVIILT
ncbi:hypothetical protein SAMN02746065_12637 [Desulfocicer vacuolatum DSM 3385]|uniref:Nucleotide-binding universal stress protein, UspA family n=1 Tax=Desulfocicer vacuolatum DSM 3385 TaxID=1121400 RepID=A0A1W2E923_9BACT|nr:hypothetical protein [Desulfocicer vacuolatum]SMD05922.1 hypothetical protein SAMN02746065_12637 [Desulfocicer vacuolatum DSM 3385]